MTDADAAAMVKRLQKAAGKWRDLRNSGKSSGRRKPVSFPPKTEPPYGNRAKPVSDRRAVPRTSASTKSRIAAAETEKLYEKHRAARSERRSGVRRRKIPNYPEAVPKDNKRGKARGRRVVPRRGKTPDQINKRIKELDKMIKAEANKAKTIKQPNTRVNPNRPKPGTSRDTAFKRARAEGRIKPRPTGHPNAPRSNPNVGKIKVTGEIKKAGGAIQNYTTEQVNARNAKRADIAKKAIRSNVSAGPRAPKNTVAKSLTKGKGLRDLAQSFSWRAGDLARKASQTGVGKALTKFAGSGAGRVAAKVGAKVAGRVLLPLGIATDVVAVVGAGTEGVRALKAQHDARTEKAGSEAKYGTVEAATRTRHARRDARRKAAAERAGKKVNV